MRDHALLWSYPRMSGELQFADWPEMRQVKR